MLCWEGHSRSLLFYRPYNLNYEPTVPDELLSGSTEVALGRWQSLSGELVIHPYEECYSGSEIAMYENKMESLFENFLFCVEIEAGAS